MPFERERGSSEQKYYYIWENVGKITRIGVFFPHSHALPVTYNLIQQKQTTGIDQLSIKSKYP